MRHIKKKDTMGCGPAAVAMLCGCTYLQACKAAPGGWKDNGIAVGPLVSMLREKADTGHWRLLTRGVPTPMRHYTPRINKGIITMTRLTAKCNLFIHYVVYDRGWLLDPDLEQRIRLSDAKNAPDWRKWAVVNEITTDCR